MGLSKAIRYGKEKRKPYYDSRRFDHSCRNHGSCGYCERKRLNQVRRERERAERMIEDYLSG